MLTDIASRSGLKIPRALVEAKFLAHLDVDRWVRCPISPKSGRSAVLWFRLEDVDTVETVITND